MRRKRKLESRIERCDYLLVSEPESKRGHWLDEYRYKALHVELGCGKGGFTVEIAKNEPEILFVAFERVSNVLVCALERTQSEGLGNVRYIHGRADDIAGIFAKDEVSRLYINFCDPWPANRHAKRRMTGERFLERYKQVLCQNGEIHFKTDNLPLFEFSLNEFTRCGFTISDLCYDLHKQGTVGVMTDYELKFHEKGLPIYRCVAGVEQNEDIIS